MTLLERLQSHKCGLLRIKSQLFWYDGRGWDKNPGRICLILDAAAVVAAAAATVVAAAVRDETQDDAAVAHLLIDGSPHWVLMAENDVEIVA
jgi:hypothetical protein